MTSMTEPNINALAVSSNTNNTDYIQQLTTQFNFTLSDINPDQTQLVYDGEKLAIHALNLGKPISIDFLAGKNAHRQQFGGGRGQPLARAIGLTKGKSPTIIDATAGFGRDAFVLASLGCQVTLIERHPWIAALLQDALTRAQADSDSSAHKMQLVYSNAPDYLAQLPANENPDVIYFDPMYPSREKSALVKKDMRLLHQLVGADMDSTALLNAALKTANKRVVVKRPSGVPWVGELSPHTQIESKNTRHDVYMIHDK
jgi:16S rRNA (guanine1516-N2)-methyltransferase